MGILHIAEEKPENKQDNDKRQRGSTGGKAREPPRMWGRKSPASTGGSGGCCLQVGLDLGLRMRDWDPPEAPLKPP